MVLRLARSSKSKSRTPTNLHHSSFVDQEVTRNNLQQKGREEQGELVQELMQNLQAKYQETFRPANQEMEAIYSEGVENCVTKNLYQVLFGDVGVGNSPNQISD